ncbi:MAG: ATP-binding protein [Flavobacteriales bacterium]
MPMIHRILNTLGCVFLIAGAHGSDLREFYWRYLEHSWRDEATQQKSLLDSLIASSEPGSEAHTLARILQARTLMVQGSKKEAMTLLDATAHDADHGDHILAYAQAEVRAATYRSVRDWEKATEQAKAALQYARAFSLDREEVDALNLLAAIERGQFDLVKALDLYIQAERLAGPLDYAAGLCKININRGNIYFDQQRFADAKSNYRSAWALAREHGYAQLVKLIGGNLAAAIQTDKDSLVEAIKVYKEAIAVAEQTNDNDLAADWRANMGKVMVDANLPMSALEEIRGAVDYYRSQGDTTNLLHPYYYMALAWSALDRTDSALAYARQSLALGLAVVDYERVADCELLIATLSVHDPAVEGHIRGYAVMRDSLEKMRMSEELARMEGAFEGRKKQLVNTALTAENKALSAETRKKRIQLLATAAITLLLIFLLFFLYRNLRHRKRLAKKERELYEQQMGDVMRQSEIRSLDALMQGQEMERKRVAKDLHDRLGSMLSAIKLQFSALESKVEKVREENKVQYDHVFSMLDDAVGEVRRISHDMLKSSLAQFGLAGALDDLREALSAPGKLEVEMSLFGLEERLEQKIEIAVFRMVQECVGNALKHAKATSISIQVTRSTAMLNVIVEDNGKGFDTVSVNEGMGLGNLRQRAAEIGGAVQFDSVPGRGTIVTIDVPLA